MNRVLRSLAVAASLLFALVRGDAAVVLNEIMYHSAAVPENHAQEWIELRNPDAVPVDVSGWKFTKGVDFTIPAATTIPAGGYLVVAANVAAFQAAHPGFTGQLVGGWAGTLTNSNEHLVLVNALLVTIDDAHFSNEGEWALRGRGPLLLAHRGWEWFTEASGGGKTIELRNPALAAFDCGQNWGVSAAVGGSPGAVNSVASANVAPLIKDVKHKPDVPHSTEPVQVSCNLHDEGAGATATLRWRLDGAAIFNSLPMTDTNSDGDVEATIPAQANLAIVEYYISATDGVNTRTWPAPARTSDIGVLPETFGQVTNVLYLVDNSFDANAAFQAAGSQPIYRLIMTAAERAELSQIQTTAGQDQSDAAMNATFISHDGTGAKVRYLIGLRNRGTGSRLGPPNNYNVGFRNDDVWENRGTLQLNCRYPHSQVLGTLCFQLAGVASQDSAAVKVRVNGVDLAEAGLRMYGRYARNETMSGDFATRHFPNDPDGNIYFLDDHNPGSVGVPAGNLGSGEFRYEGTNPAAYSDTYIKKTNEEINDYSDLIALTEKLTNTPDATFAATILPVLDVDQWFTHFATDALIGNQEGGLQSGRADDAGMYRGVVDPRFKLIPHDFDSVFSFGLTAQDPGGPGGGGAFGMPGTRSIFSYDGEAPTTGVDGVLGLRRLFTHPQIVPRYYATILAQMEKWFNHATLDPEIDRVLGGWVAATGTNVSVASAKAFIDVRRANVLTQIQQNYSLNVTTGAAAVGGFTTTTDGSATIVGTFNVAKTYSITVNGQLATWFYRTVGADAAGSWKLAVPAGGGSVLTRGLNKVVVSFWDGVGGTGKIVNQLTADVFYNVTGTTVTGTLTAGSMRLTAPSSYIPGKPILARVELLDAAGNLDRTAWDTTVTLTSNVGGITLPTVQLYNGQGSALITAGGGGGGGTTQIIIPGGTLAAPNASAPDWRMLDTGAEPAATWKSDQAFADSAWTLNKLQAGAGDGDERTVLSNVAGSAVNPRRAFYFRKIFTVANPAAFASLIIKAVVDDGAVFYLNGTEVARDNLPAGTPTLTTPAVVNRSAPAESNINTYDISAFLNLLVPGNNLLAIEVHNFSDTVPTYSGDLSFDLALDATAPSADPGAFTLTANGGGFSAQKTITSLGASPTITTATGAIAANTTWSGVVHVTGNVTVNTGVTLNVAAGTHVLFDGNATAGSATGTSLIVNGTLVSAGVQANPVDIGPFNATDKWGQISFANSQPSTLNYTLLHGAGHATGVGHTGKGPMLRLSTANVSLLDSVLSDGPAKAIYTSGTCGVTIQRSLIERMITGPELEDGGSLLCEDSNIQRILPDFRESNDALANDEDCLYVHNNFTTPHSIIVRRCVFARCGDDVFDCLGGPMTVENSILREGWDKGLSLLNNDLTISNTQIIHCDKGIAMKSRNADVRVVTATNCTIIGENHDSSIAPWGYAGGVNGGDPDTASTGFYTQNKAAQSNTGATLSLTAKNCIVIAQQPVLIDAPYLAANTVVTYSDLRFDTGAAFAWPGTGSITTDPLFVAAGTNDYHLTAASPCRNTGDPGSPLDADGSPADMGALPFTGAGAVGAGTITWTPAGGPYHITGDVTVPSGTTLIINPGTSVLVDQNRKINVNGVIKVNGTDNARVVFSNVPGVTATDPITGIAGQPAKWGGLVVVGPAIGSGPAITGSEFRYCTFLNAQPAVAAGNTGSLGIIRAFALIDHCIFLGTHLRQVYGENCALQVQYSTFVDPFDPAINADNPVAYNLDNIAEPLKVANANVVDANYVFGLPVGGYFRVWYNEFRGNKGHNDVFDADSGGFNAAAGVNNTNPILDCRYNNFLGFTGDEHIDLGGDAYIASNVFQRGHKDVWTNDHGYSNVISSGDKSGATTIWVARNVAFDVDHIMNCKASTATIFENNTIANLRADFSYTSTPPVAAFTQDVRCSAINQYVPDDNGPSRGDGAYIAGNIFHNIPRVVSWADLPATLATKLEAANNYINGITDNSVGPITAQYSGGTLHPGGFTSLGAFAQPGDPQFVNEAGGNYALKATSPARGTAPGGLDYGASIAEWIHITGGPLGSTDATTTNFTISGPAMVAYKWRLDGGAWSAVVPIGNGLIFPRGATPTVRSSTLALTGLAAGAHTLEVIGRDPAGNWQDTDLARTVGGLPPNAPTARTWTVDPSAAVIRITEVLAESATLADTIELANFGSATVNIGGWTLSDDPLVPNKYAIPANTLLAPGAFITFASMATTIALDRNGDAVYLHNGATLVDSIAFGNQIPELSIGRSPINGAWTLCTPTLGAANSTRSLGDPNAARISEWFTSGDVLYDADWIELSNPSSLPIDLGGVRITDNRIGDPQAHTFAPLTFIAASGYARFIADGATDQGPSHLSFSLDAQQENIALLSATGAQLDLIVFYPQTTDRSMGRDASGNYVFYELPTRGFLNGTGDPAYANALAILRGLRITEIMYNAIGGSDFDYIELRNVGATPLALGGVSFVQGVAFIFPAMTLNAGEYVLVVKHLAKFRSRYGNGPVVAGVYTGQLDNGGETIGLQLPPPFDANALTFNYRDTWYLPTDGFGPSLVVPNALVKANVWGDRDTWAASVENGGNPAGTTARTDTYSGFSALNAVPSVLDDLDRDSIGALLEFSLGQDITNPNGYFGVAGLPVPGRAGDGRATLSFFIPQNASGVQGLGFSDVTYVVQAADLLGTWTTIATKTFSAAWSGTATVGAPSGGNVPVTITDLALPGLPPRFLRLQVNWTP